MNPSPSPSDIATDDIGDFLSNVILNIKKVLILIFSVFNVVVFSAYYNSMRCAYFCLTFLPYHIRMH